MESSVLAAAKCDDFIIEEVLSSEIGGLVVVARCTREGLQNPNKKYALKLLYNFCNEQSSTVRNVFENEWLVLSQSLPHPNVIQFWTQFVDAVGNNFAAHLPDQIRKQAVYHDSRRKQLIRRKAQFIVLDYHAKTMREHIDKQALPLSYDLARNYTLQLLESAYHLFKQRIVHLDLTLDNILLSTDGRLIISDFGHAELLPQTSDCMPVQRGECLGGNRAYLAPEVLTLYQKRRTGSCSEELSFDYSKQIAWAVGCLIYEMVEGTHPLPDYPLGYGKPDCIVFSMEQLPHLPAHYPTVFRSTVLKLMDSDPTQRMSLAEAQVILQGHAHGLPSAGESDVENLQQRLQLVLRERDLLVAQLKAERDGAVQELKTMAEQCKFVASEFDAMAEQCEAALTDKEVLAKERDEAVRANLVAIEVNAELRDQLVSVSSERDLFKWQINDLKRRNMIASSEVLRECTRCRKFYVDSETNENLCQWHPGKVSLCMAS